MSWESSRSRRGHLLERGSRGAGQDASLSSIHLPAPGARTHEQAKGFSLPGLGAAPEHPQLCPPSSWQRAPLECTQLALGSCLTRHKTFGFHGLEICFQSKE